MFKEVLKKCFQGIAAGGIVSFIALTIIYFGGIETTVYKIWIYMLCSFIIGIYFGLSSFLFTYSDWSMLKQTVVHFTLSIIFLHIIGILVGWIPLKLQAIIFSVLFFIGVYTIHWFAFYFYYKKVAESMNNDLRKKK